MAVALAGGASSPSRAATLSAPAAAEIVLPDGIVASRVLSFSMAKSAIATPRAAVVAPASGTGRLPLAQVTPASFKVSGAGADTVSVAVPEQVTVTRSGGSETMEVETLSDLYRLSADRIAAASGTVMSVAVGGRVDLAANSIPGDYSGVMVVTAQYN